jgi:hypothetical protein
LRFWGAEKPTRELSEITGSTLGGSEGGVRSDGGGGSSIGGTTTSSLEISLVTTIKMFCSLYLFPRKYFSSQLYQRPLSWSSSISSLVNFWILMGVEEGEKWVGLE